MALTARATILPPTHTPFFAFFSFSGDLVHSRSPPAPSPLRLLFHACVVGAIGRVADAMRDKEGIGIPIEEVLGVVGRDSKEGDRITKY